MSTSTSTSSFVCQYCERPFTMKHHLKRHIEEKRCKYLKKYSVMENEFKSLKKQLDDLKHNVTTESVKVVSKSINTRIDEVEKRLEVQEKKPAVNNNVLNVICVTGNDNYLDMLTEKIGNFEQAIDYIKECALSDLTGDCKLIEKIYMSESSNIYFSDKGRNNITYYNENKEQVNDNKITFSRKLANSLQNSYLKGINYLINKNLDNHASPNKFLEEYDLMTWNTHIYNLSDNAYQRKIINQLSIPIKC
jgi:hypothetical protein